MAKPKEKDPVDIVHQNAIHVETIMKELRHQKLYTEFNINPFKKRECRASRMSEFDCCKCLKEPLWGFFSVHILTDKPMSNISYRKEEEDRKYFNYI